MTGRRPTQPIAIADIAKFRPPGSLTIPTASMRNRKPAVSGVAPEGSSDD
jgi:hypothetical protein